MIHFLFGKPGTGKTHRIFEQIRCETAQERKKIYLIVPEQSVYSAEAAFLSELPASVGQSFSVLSFSRLCDLIENQYGGRTAVSLNHATESLLMWRVMRELKGLFQMLSTPNGNDTSLCQYMLQAAMELKVNAIDPGYMENRAKQLGSNTPLYRKIRDISLAVTDYNRLVASYCGNSPADRMTRTSEKIIRNDFFKDADVYIDSFTSFTAEEYTLLTVIFRQAKNVTVTVCAESLEKESPFLSIRDTVKRLIRLCEDTGVRYDTSSLTMNRRTKSDSLLTLERALWDFSLTESPEPAPSDTAEHPIRLITAATVYDEAKAAALHIRELHDAGIPYGEIAVVVRDTAQWRNVLDAALEQCHIPYYLSERTGLSDKPAARLILTALRCIQRGFLTGDIISLAKTGLCGLDLHDLDAFTDYTETWKISGRRMRDGKWSMNPDGYSTERNARGTAILNSANAVWEKLIPPLVKLADALESATDPCAQCRALYTYLTDLSVREQLADQAKKYLATGMTQQAGETVRLWTFITEALANVALFLPNDEGKLSADELGAALSLMFDCTDIGSVPGRHDCVTVGSASTLRVERIQAVLLLGLCEGEFPLAVTDKGLLSEQDKENLATVGIQFSDRADTQTSEELLYVYRAVTKASRFVYAFTHEGTPDNTAKSPSIVFTRLRWLFPACIPLTFKESCLNGNGTDMSCAPSKTDTLNQMKIRSVLTDTLTLSNSALTNYSRCPYSYFGSHILRIREKTEAKIDSMNAGIFLHYVMEHYLRQSLDDRNRIRPLTDAELVDVTDRLMTDYIQSLCVNAESDGRILHLFARLRTIALVLVTSVQRELEQGLFYVAGLEWSIAGKKASDPLPLEISVHLDAADAADNAVEGTFTLPTAHTVQQTPNTPLFSLPVPRTQTVTVTMNGRIDRVDVYRDGNTAYIRVIDYKSSQRIFTEKSVTDEMNVQLLLYLFTLCSPRNRWLFADENGREPDSVLPAEVLYISPTTDKGTFAIKPNRSGLVVDTPTVLHAVTPGDNMLYLPGIKKSAEGVKGFSLCTPAHMDELNDTIQTLIADVTKSLYSGHVTRTPDAKACRFCSLGTACPFAVKEKL